MGKCHPWVVCVRVNRHDKAYFLNQVEGFSRSAPLLVAWEDGRPAAEREATPETVAVLPTSWERRWRFPGGHRLLGIARRLRAALAHDPLAAGHRERAALEDLAARSRPDVIYAHTGFVGLRLLALKDRLGVPLVVHFHGLDLNTRDPVYQRCLRRDLHRFDHVVVAGNWMVARLVALGYAAERISVIPMGTPVARVGRLREARNGPARGPVRFIAVGHMIPYKGVDRTIEAFARLHATRGDVELVLVGDGTERAALERLARSGPAAAAIRFTGSLSSDATLARMAVADVLLHHALDHPGGPEAFGVVITEGMALGLPVVGSRCGGLVDQIVDGETGFLVDQDDVAGMVRAMGRLAADPDLRAAMGAAGRARATGRFDAQDLARQAEDILIAQATHRLQ
jgi:colanic acid/amylovoran biosynthesis glycosyltransferase